MSRGRLQAWFRFAQELEAQHTGGLLDLHDRLRTITIDVIHGGQSCNAIIDTWRAAVSGFERAAREEHLNTAAAMAEAERRRQERVHRAEEQLARLREREEEARRKKQLETMARRRVRWLVQRSCETCPPWICSPPTTRPRTLAFPHRARNPVHVAHPPCQRVQILDRGATETSLAASLSGTRNVSLLSTWIPVSRGAAAGPPEAIPIHWSSLLERAYKTATVRAAQMCV